MRVKRASAAVEPKNVIQTRNQGRDGMNASPTSHTEQLIESGEVDQRATRNASNSPSERKTVFVPHNNAQDGHGQIEIQVAPVNSQGEHVMRMPGPLIESFGKPLNQFGNYPMDMQKVQSTKVRNAQ